MRTIIVALLLLLAALQYRLWVSDSSITQWFVLEKKLSAQEGENAKLAARNKALEADILELKQGDQALEEQARYELGMIREDETYYQFSE